MVKDGLLAEISHAYRSMADLVEQIPDGRLENRAMDEWTGKDLVAHLAWWHDHSTRVVEALRGNRPPYDAADPDFDLDALNERTRREHALDTEREVREAFERTFERLLAALEPLSDADLFDAGQWPWLEGEALAEMLRWDTSRHYEAHYPFLSSLLDGPAG